MLDRRPSTVYATHSVQQLQVAFGIHSVANEEYVAAQCDVGPGSCVDIVLDKEQTHANSLFTP